MLHKNSADKFSFEDCKFTVQRSKESTGKEGRGAVLRRLFFAAQQIIVTPRSLINIKKSAISKRRRCQ
jgi:hypothetical protein